MERQFAGSPGKFTVSIDKTTLGRGSTPRTSLSAARRQESPAGQEGHGASLAPIDAQALFLPVMLKLVPVAESRMECDDSCSSHSICTTLEMQLHRGTIQATWSAHDFDASRSPERLPDAARPDGRR